MRGVLMAATLLLATGCGASEELSATAYRERANAICRDLRQANEKALKGVDPGDRPAIERATREVGRRTTEALDELGDLNGPDTSEAGVDRFLARAQEVREASTRQVDALSAGKADDVEKAGADVRRLADEVTAAARDAGLDDCA